MKTMLDLQKLVLQNVAEDKRLFKKELRKSMEWLNSDELSELSDWLRENFRDTHFDVIEETLHIEEQRV